MKTNRSNNYTIKPGKVPVHGFRYPFGLLLAVLLAGLSLVIGACTAGTTTGSTSGTTTGSTSGTTTGSTSGTTTGRTSGTTTGSTSGTTTGSTVALTMIDADEALQILKDNPGAVLLDVRTEQEFVSGHIAGAVLIPVDEIHARLTELPEDKNTPIIIYCRSGNRSSTAARMLIIAGYRSVYDLGGINSWPYEIVR